jgi:hypothetical protein
MRSASGPLREQSSDRGLCHFTCGNAPDMASTTCARPLLVWHAHGSCLESLAAGAHRDLVPVELAELCLGRRPGIDVPALAQALQDSVTDHAAATLAGKGAREHARAHFALDRFLAQWDEVIEERCA